MAPHAPDGAAVDPQDPPPTDPPAHQWWVIRNRGEHGRDCGACRRAPGGPDARRP